MRFIEITADNVIARELYESLANEYTGEFTDMEIQI